MNDGSPDRLDPVGASSTPSLNRKDRVVNDKVTDQPAELRKAAQTLRETATKAMPGPWESLEGGDRLVAWKVGSDGFDDDFDYVVDEPVDHSGNAEWIALTNPLLAEPLAQWLETEAHMVDIRGLSAEGQTFHALKVARAINGTAR